MKTKMMLVLSVALSAGLLSGCKTDSAGKTNDASAAALSGSPTGWLSWRGPHQNGTSDEIGLVETVTLDGENHVWTVDLHGRGTPVVANGRLYTMGYVGEGPDLQEMIVCFDARTGKRIWDHRFSDFVSDVIYDRYAIGSPTVDPATGNVFCKTTPGLLNCFTRDGKLLWQRSMMESYGRLSFPNGRTGAPVIDGDLMIIHEITSSWGKVQGPARTRFFAFDTATGDLVWICTPGSVPKDSSFAMPVLAWENGKRVLYAGTGCGRLARVDARTGDPLWAQVLSIGGINSSAVLFQDSVIQVHGKENLDASNIGRLVALKRGTEEAVELWRNDDVIAFTSSPVLVGDRYYQTILTGELYCVNAVTGESLWHEKLGSDQIHASPAWGDGKLYVPMNNGSFHIIRPGDDGPEPLCEVQLAGNCLGAPAIAGGCIYVHTTEKLYCFGKPAAEASWPAAEPAPAPSAAVRLQVIPCEAVVHPGEKVPTRLRSLDEHGNVITETEIVVTAPDAPGISTKEHVRAGLVGAQSLRIVPALPFTEDWETTKLRKVTGQDFFFPPSYWMSAAPKWQVMKLDDGNTVIARRMDNPLFQRTQSFFGHPDDSEYTMTMDVMSEGTRRSMSSPGMINQRYLIVLKGNYQTLEISSNMERVKESVPYKWKPNTWYTLKSQVVNRDDGSALVRAKVWPRDEPEPAGWMEVTHANGHTHGAAALYGFTPQSRFPLYVDNIEITPNSE